MDYNVFRGILELIGLIVFLLIGEFRIMQHDKRSQSIIEGLIEGIKAANNNPATLSAIQGATNSVPPQIFQQCLSVLSTLRLFAPTAQLQALDDNVSQFVKNIEPQPIPIQPQMPLPVTMPPYVPYTSPSIAPTFPPPVVITSQAVPDQLTPTQDGTWQQPSQTAAITS